MVARWRDDAMKIMAPLNGRLQASSGSCTSKGKTVQAGLILFLKAEAETTLIHIEYDDHGCSGCGQQCGCCAISIGHDTVKPPIRYTSIRSC
jgi:hypothetical protein